MVLGRDIIVSSLVKNDIGIVFTVSGGAIVPLLDSLSIEPRIRVIMCQHEQSAAMAAEGYYRTNEKMAAVLVTSGPGAQNILNGICGCFYDSIPALFITGNVNTKESISSLSCAPRQRGFQEMPVIESFSSFCVFAKKVTTIKNLSAIMERAIITAKTSRFGPSLIDIPVNFQMASIEITPTDFLPDNNGDELLKNTILNGNYNNFAQKVIELIQTSKRPLILIGGGVRAAKAFNAAQHFILNSKIPCVTTWGAKDFTIQENPLLTIGHIGVYGSRTANLAVQTCDALIIIGARLDTRQTGGNVATFASSAKKIYVDIDQEEILKLKDIGIILSSSFRLDAHKALDSLNKNCELFTNSDYSAWHKQITCWESRFNQHDYDEKYIQVGNPYIFFSTLTEILPLDVVIVCDTGANMVTAMQEIRIKHGQRMFSNLGNSSMGYSIPSAIGAAFAAPHKTIISIIGDGGAQMNIQELKTIVDYNLNIKIIIMNNQGYALIQQFQDSYFDSRHACTKYSNINFVSLAAAYGMKSEYVFVNDSREIVKNKLKNMFFNTGPFLLDIALSQNSHVIPKLEFGNALENMTPFVDELETCGISLTPKILKKGWVQVD